MWCLWTLLAVYLVTFLGDTVSCEGDQLMCVCVYPYILYVHILLLVAVYGVQKEWVCVCV